MNAVFGYLVLAVFYGWLVLSSVARLYWFWRPEREPYSMRLGLWVNLGLFFAVMFLLIPVFEAVLSFIPFYWRVRLDLPSFLAFCCGLGAIVLLNPRERSKDEDDEVDG